MIKIPPPDYTDQKQVESYFIQLIIYSDTPYDAFKEFCRCEHGKDVRDLEKSIINSEYSQIKRRYKAPLLKELL